MATFPHIVPISGFAPIQLPTNTRCANDEHFGQPHTPSAGSAGASVRPPASGR